MYILLFHAIPVELSRRTHISYCFIDLAKMHSFLFPEDINGSPTRQRPQQSTTSPRRTTTQETTRAPPPRMPTRAPLTIPQQNFSAPATTDLRPATHPHVKRKASYLHHRARHPRPKARARSPTIEEQMVSPRDHQPLEFKERREAKARAAEAMPEIEVVLPPLSPVVNEEFWRTGGILLPLRRGGTGWGIWRSEEQVHWLISASDSTPSARE